MLLAAAMALNIDLKKSWMVGDKGIDLLAAKAAGTQGILVQTGHGATEQTKLLPGTIVAADLPAAVSIILQHHGANGGMTP
jgi:phosphoglycolate phosphatase-like HAD superfamily hydrolase